MSGGNKNKGGGSDVTIKPAHADKTQGYPTVSVAVVGVCDAPETLLSCSVPNLQGKNKRTSSPFSSITIILSRTLAL